MLPASYPRWSNRTVTGGIVFLILFSPLAFGSVHPWAFALMEATLFLLVIVWMGMLMIARSREQGAGSQTSEVRGQRADIRGQRSEARDRLPAPSSMLLAKRLSLPLALFFAFILFQLLPLPPSLLRLTSPSTFELYTQSLPGWPEAAPYAELAEQRAGSGEQGAKSREHGARSQTQNLTPRTEGPILNPQSASGSKLQAPRSMLAEPKTQRPTPVILPTLDEVKAGAPIPFEEQRSEGAGSREQGAASKEQSAILPSGSKLPAPSSMLRDPPSGSMLHALSSVLPSTWLPLSLAPSRTRSDLLKIASYAALFFLVLLYPFEESKGQGARSKEQGSQRLHASGSTLPAPCSMLLFVVIFCGLIVATLGFIQRFTWNGMILWFFVPYDWGSASPGNDPRASGPFVNPDHFANYLALIFPLAVGTAIHSRYLFRKEIAAAMRIFAGLAAFLIFTGILLSLSRSGWIAMLLGVSLLLWLSPGWGGAGSKEHGAGSDNWQRAKSKEQSAEVREHGAWSGEQGGKDNSQSEIRNFRARCSSFALFAFSAVKFVFPTLSPRRNPQSGIRNPQFKIPNSKSAVRNSQFPIRFSLIILSVLLIVSLFFVGPRGREQVDVRLGATMTEDAGLWGRTSIWSDTVKMVRDFPVLGVGLGSWQDLFQRYQSPPWGGAFYREAHNDYLELLAETGLVGLGLLAWFFWLGGKKLWSHLQSSADVRSKAFVAMLLAALGVMAFHEFFDFSLQIPANAFLFTILFALALRIAAASNSQSAIRNSRFHAAGSVLHALCSRLVPFRLPPGSMLLAPCSLLLAVLLLFAALRQEMTPYPYNLTMPGSVAEAREMILGHPALPTPHLYLLRLVEKEAPLEWETNELKAALWLDPNNPNLRDLYAGALLMAGKKEEGLKEISRSIVNAPSFSDHVYLNGRFFPWLSTDEKNAVERGFKEALALDYPGAMDGLASFYARTGRFADQGRLFEQAAARTKDVAAGADLAVKAAHGYLKAGDPKRAETLLQKAISIAPDEPRPYQALAMLIYAPQKEIDQINKIISEGIKNGAPAFELQLAVAEAMKLAGEMKQSETALKAAEEAVQITAARNGNEPESLYIALAETAQKLGFRDKAKAALAKALDLNPSSPEVLNRLAQLHLQDRDFNHAAYYFRSIINVNPTASDAYYHLAVAEEGQYRFAAAGEAYTRAIELAPENGGYRDRYKAFKVRVEENRKREP